MRPLTDRVPKALLKIGEQCLIEYHIRALVHAGICRIVINCAYLGGQIAATLGDGERYGAAIRYSPEGVRALETGGGIVNALPYLKNEPFAVINADVWTNLAFSRLPADFEGSAFIILVDNPAHHRGGDFSLQNGRVVNNKQRRLTYSGIGVFRPEFFSGCRPGRYPLAPLLVSAINADQVAGEYYDGVWIDVGTI